MQPEELDDPIGDDAHSPVEGIVHRYPDRVLLKLTHVCAVYCRFCFRREMVGPGKAQALSAAALARALDYIRSDRQIWEVILTGGDPLVLSARRLRDVMKRLAAIEHVKVLRIHTRVPVAEPARVTRGTGAGDQGQGQGDLRGRAHQSSARTDAQARAPPARAGRCRHSAARPIGAAGRRQRHAGSARRPDARAGRMPDQAVLPASRRSGARHRASAHRHRDRAGLDARACAGDCPGCASRPTCSTFPAATANRRSARTISRAPARTAARISSSRISTGGGIAIRRRPVRPRRDDFSSAGSTADRAGPPPPRGWRSR